MDHIPKIKQHFADSAQLKRDSVDALAPAIARAATALTECLLEDGKILACGNGGSAADAQHFAAEMVGRFERERPDPGADRLLVTNHESLGYFAESYGFTVVGTIVPSVTTGASPSARQLARLIDELRATGVKAVFLESGTDPNLARQVAREAGIRVVTELYTHSLTDAGGPAPSYIRMMEYDVKTIVDALGGVR